MSGASVSVSIASKQVSKSGSGTSVSIHDKSQSSLFDFHNVQQSVKMYDWDKKASSASCKCYGYVLQLVLVASVCSFLFGFNLSLLNTALAVISWELWPCNDSEVTDYYSDDNDFWTSCDISTAQGNIAGCRGDDNPCYVGEGDDQKTCSAPGPGKCWRQIWFGACMSTAVFIGAAVGSLSGGGFLASGRRLMILGSMVVFTFGIISSVVSNSFSALLWARLVVGYGVGVVSLVTPTYMSEITPPARRGAYGVFHQLFITVGIFVAVLIGLPFHDVKYESVYINIGTREIYGLTTDVPMFDMVWWRVMLGIGMIPVIMCFWYYGKVYSFETPAWYVEKRRYKDAEMLLKRLHGGADVSEELSRLVHEQDEARKSREAGMSLGVAWKSPEYRHVIVVGCLLSAFQQFGGINAFIASSNSLFAQAGMTGTMVTVLSSLMTFINVLMTFPSIWLIEKMGRKSLLLMGVIGQTIGVGPATIMYWIIPDEDATMYAAIAGVFVFVVFFAVAYGPVLWVYLFEIYPTEIKGAAAGVATALNWVAGIVMVFITAVITDNVINYSIFFVLNIVSIPIVLFLMKETKGRALGDSPFISKKNAV